MASHLPTMNWSDPDLSEAISLFKQKMSLYLEDEEITDADKQARKICRGIGDEGLKRLNASGLSKRDKKVPDMLWEYFEGQLKLNVNFRIHRLHLMQYRQRPDESIDDFVTRARTLAQKCQFTDEELIERIIELIIASTPHDALRNDLYSKPKGHSLAEVLTEGRKYEALSAGNEQLNKLGMSHSEKIHVVDRGRTCQNCNTNHKPRQCPAYHDECSACGIRGHWARCCKKAKRQQQHSSRGPRSKSRVPQDKQHRQTFKTRYRRQSESHVDAIGDNDAGEECTYQKQFHSVIISEKCMHSIDSDTPREEVYTILNVKPPDLTNCGHTLRVKVDTGASGNALPLRTFKQMYGKNACTQGRLTKNHKKISAYSGHEITCLGTINIPCQYKGSEWVTARFYVVDVPGPAILGLPTCELLKLVTVNVDTMTESGKANQEKETGQRSKTP